MPTYHARDARSTTSVNILALSTGAVAALGSLAVLWHGPLFAGQPWTLDHGLMPLLIGVTIAAGHLTGVAVRERRRLAGLCFVVAFIVGTLLTAYFSIGSQKASRASATAAAAAVNETIAARRVELDTSRQRLADATRAADREMTGEACGKRCKDWRTRASEVQSHIRVLEAEIMALGAPLPVDPRAEAFADVLALLGADRGRVVAVAGPLAPLALSLLLEWVCIAALGFAFAHRPRPVAPAVAGNVVTMRPSAPVAALAAATVAGVAVAEAPVAPVVAAPATVAGNALPDPWTRDTAIADLTLLLVSRGELPVQEALCERWAHPDGRPRNKGTVSKWVAEAEARGLVHREAEGRCKAVSL